MKHKTIGNIMGAGLLAGILVVSSILRPVVTSAVEEEIRYPEITADYSRLDNTTHGWGLCTNTEHIPPVNAGSEIFPDYRTYYYVDTEEPDIYLGFDCGYENGYIPTILDTLKQYQVKAIFMVTKPYIMENADLVKRMKEEGHLVGNHTVSHLSSPSLSDEEFKRELADCADYMKQVTGYEMDPYFRPPMGEYSQRILKLAQDLGYTTILWSMAFYDYDVENQPGANVIYEQFMTNYHKGAIPLLHSISQSDTEALPSIITSMQEKGYQFKTLDELATVKQDLRIHASTRGAKDGSFKVTVEGMKMPGRTKILYYDYKKIAMKKAPDKPGIYYVQAFTTGNSEYKSACSKMMKVRWKKK